MASRHLLTSFVPNQMLFFLNKLISSDLIISGPGSQASEEGRRERAYISEFRTAAHRHGRSEEAQMEGGRHRRRMEEGKRQKKIRQRKSGEEKGP
ncbi:hypothetical protein BC937DRAFT_95517 [Endogone sp. FLAS-F59071]|nr:hypothetical protein BC937DRAFT_95517 [Endogone sp. FLAS-F59071]|eukprot:RUS20301.1 hypothetical protein BC937DRAFT_95517 [Endogone sp. FLAS-F59071]